MTSSNNVIYRMCVQTREVCDRQKMLRLVVSTDNVKLDNSGEIQGRSIYIQNDIQLITKFLKRKKLPIRLESNKQDQVRAILEEYINEK